MRPTKPNPNRNQIRYRRATVVSTVLLATLGCLLLVPEPVAAQTPTGHELREGAIIDPARGLVYVMAPAGGIEAVDLANGTITWRSDQVAKPLALAGNRLVGLATGDDPREMNIVTLDAGQQGRHENVASIELPAGVRVSPVETLRGRFELLTAESGGRIDIFWTYTSRAMRGAEPPDEREGEPEGRPVLERERTVRSGVARLTLATGAMTPGADHDPAVPPERRRPILVDAERLDGIDGPQFVSADGAHVLTSERTADDRTWDKYTWTIRERGTGRQVGEFRAHTSHAPFYVTGNTLVRVTGPYVRRVGEEYDEQALSLRAVDLDSQQEIWVREIRDTKYRGPFPP